jgi:hypothetical protein
MSRSRVVVGGLYANVDGIDVVSRNTDLLTAGRD